MDKMKINTKGIMDFVWEIADVLVTLIKGILIIGGAVASASADVVLGALTLALLLVNTSGTIEEVKYAPVMISLGASGIQLILWQIIQNKGGVRKVLSSKNIASLIAFVAVFLMKFADDFMDVTIVNYLMVGSVLPISLGDSLFSLLRNSVMFIVWVLTGFSEIFVVNAIELMKGMKQENQHLHQNQTRPVPTNKYIPSQYGKTKFNMNDEIFDQLKGKKN